MVCTRVRTVRVNGKAGMRNFYTRRWNSNEIVAVLEERSLNTSWQIAIRSLD